MNKSDLIEKITNSQDLLDDKDIKLAVDSIIEQMFRSLAANRRIEIRGFGSFALRELAPHLGRNPKTGARVHLDYRHTTHFKPGKELKARVNRSGKNTLQ